MRKLFVVVGIIVALLVVALVVVATNLDRIVNKNKDFFLTRAETTLGRKVSVGDVGVTLRGGIGVRLENISIGEDPAFGSEPFVEASELQVAVKLLPLLKKKFEVKRITLRDPVIRIVKDKNGVLNTQSLVTRAAGGQATGETQTGAAGAEAIPLVVSLASIENGEVDYTDEMQGVALRVRRIETSVKDFALDEPLSLELEAALLADERNLKVRGTFGPVPKEAPRGEAGPIVVPVDLDAVIDALDVTAVLTTFPRVAAGLPKEVRIGGPVGVHLTAKGTSADASVRVTLDGSRIDLQGPQGFKKTAGVPLSVDMNGRYTPQKLIIEAATAKFAALKLDADGEYVIGEPPSLALNIRSKDISLAGWEAIVPMAAPYKLSGKAELTARVEGELKPGQIPAAVGTAKIIDGSAVLPQAIKPLTGISAEIAFTQERAEVKHASLQMGGSRIEGHATVDKFKPLSLVYEATSASLALADVKPPQPGAKKPEHLDGLAAKGHLTVDPVSKEPSGEGTVVSPSGSIANVDYTNLGASYTIAGKTIRITDMNVRALEGELKGGGVITTGEKESSFNIELAANKVDITELLTALPGSVRQSIRGTASMNLSMSGSGKEWLDVQKTLKGSGLAELFDGEILDVNFATAIFDEIGRYVGAANLIPNQLRSKYPSVFETKNTSFKDLKSDFVVENGKILARNLQFTHSDYRIGAKGSLGFDRSLDMAATFVVSKKLTDDLARSYPAVAFFKNAQGEIELPLVLAGGLPRVQVKPDTEYIRNVVGKSVVEKGLNELKNDYLKKLLPAEKKSPSPPDTTK